MPVSSSREGEEPLLSASPNTTRVLPKIDSTSKQYFENIAKYARPARLPIYFLRQPYRNRLLANFLSKFLNFLRALPDKASGLTHAKQVKKLLPPPEYKVATVERISRLQLMVNRVNFASIY